MKTTIEKDGDGYLAKVKDNPNLFAFAYSEEEAIIELKNVVEMIMDYHLEQINNERLIRNELISMQEKHAVQV
jgi:predicted RNase H-like HicB family nuclease